MKKNLVILVLSVLLLCALAASPGAQAAETANVAMLDAAPGPLSAGDPAGWSRLLAPAETGRGLQALGCAALLALAVDLLRASETMRRRRRSRMGW